MEIDKIKISNTQYDIASKGSVRYDISQSLTDAQKEQACSNISAVDIGNNLDITGVKTFANGIILPAYPLNPIINFEEGKIFYDYDDGHMFYQDYDAEHHFTDFDGTPAVIYCSRVATGSDAKLKDNVDDINWDVLEKIDSVGLKQFNLKSDPDKIHYGVIAQDLQNAGLLDAVTASKTYLAVDYNDVLILKLASAEKKIKELEARLEALENKLK